MDNRVAELDLIDLFEFSQNFNVEYLENLESVKTMPETNFKVFLKIKIQEFSDKEILHIF